jgi:CheY-like chemotaxis protein
MDFNQWTKLLEIIVSFLQVIIWPLAVLIIFFYLRNPLKKLLDDLIEINFKAGPFETTAKRKQVAAASLSAAMAHWQDQAPDDKQIPAVEKAKEIAQKVDELITPGASRKLEGTSILWVDDRPMLTTYERQALEALGIQFTISKSTEDALERLGRKTFDVIISDMSRPPDQQAGYTLLEKIKEMHITTPCIIYASGKKPEYKEEARRRGAFGNTNEPQELLELVVKAIT